MNKFQKFESEVARSRSQFSIPIMSHIDDILDGGIQTGLVSELYGEAGTGKSQICMVLMINYILSDPQNKAIYISNAKQLQTDRFLILYKYRLGKKQQDRINQIQNQCIIQHLSDPKALNEYLYDQLEKELEKTVRCHLLVIDNVDHYFRELTMSYNQQQKLSAYRKFSVRLHTLAKRFNLAILLVNNAIQSFGNKVQPSLGSKWSEMVDDRFCVEKKGLKRIFRVELSHHLPIDEVSFTISDNGLQPVID